MPQPKEATLLRLAKCVRRKLGRHSAPRDLMWRASIVFTTRTVCTGVVLLKVEGEIESGRMSAYKSYREKHPTGKKAAHFSARILLTACSANVAIIAEGFVVIMPGMMDASTTKRLSVP